MFSASFSRMGLISFMIKGFIVTTSNCCV
ncbi:MULTISPECIES: hypothetical protein [Olivibacter]|uniref:Uncharacterized protein n=1 Tax=Olivibacter oleidegradans TaxID=760123 RepID=A0ABV6HEK6_9SPHI